MLSFNCGLVEQPEYCSQSNSKMSKIFFTSDLHFSHANIIKYCGRPWSTVDEMDLALVERWNSAVSDEDDIYILGDVFLCPAVRAHLILDALNGRKHLVLGNHDKTISGSMEMRRRFNILPPLYSTTLDGIKVVMCHFPLLSWEAQHYGSVMLHGHAHGKIPHDPAIRRLDVGVDAHGYAPVEWTQVKQVLSIQ